MQVFYFYFLFLCIEFLWIALVNKLYRFQVYNSIIHHLYIVLCAHHPKSSLLPSPGIPFRPPSTSLQSPFRLVITILLSASMWFFSIPSPFSPSPQCLSPLIAVSLFSISESVSILFVRLCCPLYYTFE